MIRCDDCKHSIKGANLWDNKCRRIKADYKSPVSKIYDKTGYESCQIVRVHGECGEDVKLFEAK